MVKMLLVISILSSHPHIQTITINDIEGASTFTEGIITRSEFILKGEKYLLSFIFLAHMNGV